LRLNSNEWLSENYVFSNKAENNINLDIGIKMSEEYLKPLEKL
jgi:hypothetical protein